MKYCAVAAGALGLTTTDLMKIEKAMATSTADGGTQVVWLNGAACTGCTVTLANTAYLSSIQDLLVPWAKAAPAVAAAAGLTTAQLVAAIDGGVLTDTGANGPLDLVFMETLSSSVGHTAINAAKSALAAPFVLCIEGAIQTESNGDFCRIGDGTSATDTDTISFANEVMEFATSSNCVAILAVGTCASYGGIPAAKGSVTGARGLISTGKISGGYKKTDTAGLWDMLKADYSGGFIESIEVTYGGSGYSSTPGVTISGGGSGAAVSVTMAGAGATQTVGTITVTSAGSGYTDPVVTIDAPPGGGTIATAEAHLGFNLSTGISNSMWTNLLSKTICVPGCPPHPDWIVGTIVYLLSSAPTFEPPLMDKWHRPFDYYGEYQCTNCIWQTNNPGKNNDGADLKDILNQNQSIWSKGKPTEGNSPRLYKDKYASNYEGCLGVMGCKGRKTKADCGYRRWNSDTKNGNGAGWCVQTRGGCHGCTDPRFPDGWGKFFSFV
jgi:Ni,Fe-hydrogenase I small subunit